MSVAVAILLNVKYMRLLASGLICIWPNGTEIKSITSAEMRFLCHYFVNKAWLVTAKKSVYPSRRSNACSLG